VELMGIAAQIEALEGIQRAGLVMATPANLGVVAAAGLANAVPAGAGSNDLIVVVAAADEAVADAAVARAAALLAAGGGGGSDEGSAAAPSAQTLGEGVAELPDANLALISTPGTYAAAEALRALKLGLNVFLFSDNVSIEDEIRLKTLADERGLLVMGPDCGTAIVADVPLGFANAVRSGPIGLVGASGTGLQQVTSLIHRLGSGVSHAFGTGGRDLDERVGGRTMLAALRRLLDDPATQVIVLISKPPSATVAARILEAVRSSPKPVVVNFLGGDPASVHAVGAHPAATFEAAARLAVSLATGDGPTGDPGPIAVEPSIAARGREAAARLAPGQTEIRGLFSGGSLAGEAKVVLRALLGPDRHDRILDLGDDEYTVGRPHPMIDPRLRNETIVASAAEPSVAILLLDVVIGHASHPDPAGALAPAIADATARAAAMGRELLVVASVCGTDLDPQGLGRQEETLDDAGVLLESSNARAATLAAAIALEAGRTSVAASPSPLVGAAD
ncbi:MAG TPA: acyl-CoA synthetase FdrA, partial [Candidatus Limnocylindrales bacterium]|nr:acyl-CoA synthetase FdrA [Candidatus Limnocylindrales bacterium]